MMDQNQDDSNERKTNKNVTKSKNCNQCDFVSSWTSNLIEHLKTHSVTQCDFASIHASNLRQHLKKHSGEKPNKCNECDYASSRAVHLTTHMKKHVLYCKIV